MNRRAPEVNECWREYRAAVLRHAASAGGMVCTVGAAICTGHPTSRSNGSARNSLFERSWATGRRGAMADGSGTEALRVLFQECLPSSEVEARHYSLGTESAYVHWIRRFVPFY
jgi:hypothetical protein